LAKEKVGLSHTQFFVQLSHGTPFRLTVTLDGLVQKKQRQLTHNPTESRRKSRPVKVMRKEQSPIPKYAETASFACPTRRNSTLVKRTSALQPSHGTQFVAFVLPIPSIPFSKLHSVGKSTEMELEALPRVRVHHQARPAGRRSPSKLLSSSVDCSLALNCSSIASLKSTVSHFLVAQ